MDWVKEIIFILEKVQIDAKTPRVQAIDKTIWGTPPGHIRMADGLANWMDRFSAIGNGQVPAVVRLAWKILTGE